MWFGAVFDILSIDKSVGLLDGVEDVEIFGCRESFFKRCCKSGVILPFFFKWKVTSWRISLTWVGDKDESSFSVTGESCGKRDNDKDGTSNGCEMGIDDSKVSSEMAGKGGIVILVVIGIKTESDVFFSVWMKIMM